MQRRGLLWLASGVYVRPMFEQRLNDLIATLGCGKVERMPTLKVVPIRSWYWSDEVGLGASPERRYRCLRIV